MTKFRKATDEEMATLHSHRMDRVHCSADEISAILGSALPGSSDGKTDAEWVAADEFGNFIWLWNYKDAGYLGEEFDTAEQRDFSVWFSDESILDELRKAITANLPAKKDIEIFRENVDVHEMLTAQGWAHGMTGGGCTAYTKNTSDPSIGGGHPDGWYWMITDAMDPTAPTKKDQMITLGLYDEDGMPIVMLTFSIALVLSRQIVVEDFYGGPDEQV